MGEWKDGKQNGQGVYTWSDMVKENIFGLTGTTM